MRCLACDLQRLTGYRGQDLRSWFCSMSALRCAMTGELWLRLAAPRGIRLPALALCVMVCSCTAAPAQDQLLMAKLA